MLELRSLLELRGYVLLASMSDAHLVELLDLVTVMRADVARLALQVLERPERAQPDSGPN